VRLSKDDRFELVRAAIKAPDLESLRDYIVSVADAMDDPPQGKTEIPCPRYIVPGANGHGRPVTGQEGTLL
jgi:hypothetical protein